MDSVLATCLHLAYLTLACYLQAGLEDNPPVYVLGGNMIPLGASSLMTTTALRASNLTLLAAFPAPGSPPFERCGQACTVQSTAKLLVTCGHMYLDHGTYQALTSPARVKNCMPGHVSAWVLHAQYARPSCASNPLAVHKLPACMSCLRLQPGLC